ncbi:MAG: glutamine synthetase type III [Bacteroidetes bacterium]|nr:MAG: glutamine synthetase type III [Bacteroidota bacterium]TAG90721.1 MAG: glutamine synthetase type III [Bacteroidota bacterium]
MAILRFNAIETAQNRATIQVNMPAQKVSDYFGTNVFNDNAMRQYLSVDAYKKLQQCVEQGLKIDNDLADAVAGAMKTWAMTKGVTHYTHWFQPLTGTTAEKHDSFYDIDSKGNALEKFKGTALAQQEPDASSFPSGGIRATFEARGYTAWDSSSPAFIMEIEGSKTLCIPTIFVSYTGEALDYKTPLLKALSAVDKAATAICSEYFDKDITKVVATLGAEQEYFLVDKALFYARPDLMMAGRSVFGHAPAKGQQLEDHYFGSIPSRVRAYMVDFEIEAQKLGIPIRTRHNEVAPAQFECAPTFEEVNLAVDHNTLLMDVMEKVAERHNFKVLFHEKPFAGINGSGKHNNWALGTNTGKNLLAPTSKAKENLQFLTFFVNTIKAVHDYSDLLRASIASAGNDYRLGANEAPPAIISVFAGAEMKKILDELEHNSSIEIEKGDNLYMKLGINKVPQIILDTTDRNRTSPFAFTGNKFEFRAVGGSANCAAPMLVLNTIMAHQLQQFKKDVDKASEKTDKKEVAIVNVLRDYIKKSKNVLFEGDNYSEEWAKEAEKRGLPNVKSTPQALDAYISEKSLALFEDLGIMTHREVEARYEINLENYIKKVQIESRVMGDLALNHIIPAAITYQNELIKNIKNLSIIGMGDIEGTDTVKEAIADISKYIGTIQKGVKQMIDARKEANLIEHSKQKAIAYEEKVKSLFDSIRYAVDKLELIVDDNLWPLAKYRELLMIR